MAEDCRKCFASVVEHLLRYTQSNSIVITPTFPKLSDEEMKRRLRPPIGPVRMVFDTDAKNTIDDQFAIAWALMSENQLSGGFMASTAVAGNAFIMRTKTHIYRIE